MKYEVTYSLGTDPNQTMNGAFVSRTDVNNLKIVVDANGPNNACAIVEAMFGGRLRCRAANAYPVR